MNVNHSGIAGSHVQTARSLVLDREPVVVHRVSDAYSATIHNRGVAEVRFWAEARHRFATWSGQDCPPLHGAILLLEDKCDVDLGRIDL